ncbi:ATP-binding protein [Sphingomonas aerolata]|uniref:ATP-binding protein n=1 Tax=Sphingomonas aerolata TaxID=185951 RepID=UPI002FDF5DA3
MRYTLACACLSPSAIVGQDEMKRALPIAAVDARIGGVMVLGDRGTGKSTAVRALAALLPPVRADQAGHQDGTPRSGHPWTSVQADESRRSRCSGVRARRCPAGAWDGRAALPICRRKAVRPHRAPPAQVPTGTLRLPLKSVELIWTSTTWNRLCGCSKTVRLSVNCERDMLRVAANLPNAGPGL